MKHKLSQWHSADTKPVHVGVYQTKDINRGTIEYSVYDKGNWYLSNVKQELAEIFRNNNHISWIQNKQWRGIVK